MGELASVEKLREWLHADAYEHPEMMAIVDEIEREVSERFMELPVDADGAPIHVGDTLLKSTGAPKASYGEVVGVSDDSIFFNARQGWESNWAKLTRHVKSRTVEDVLRAFYHDASDADAFCTVRLDDVLAKYADELRGMMEADDD